MVSILCHGHFVLSCKCWRGEAKSEVFGILIFVLTLRFAVAFCLGERRSKMITYLFLPLISAFIINQLAIRIMGH